MTARIRRKICEKISQVTNTNNIYHDLEVASWKKQTNPAQWPTLHWTVDKSASSNMDEQQLLRMLPQLNYDKEIVEEVRLLPAQGKNQAKVEFQLQPQAFVEALLTTTMEQRRLENAPHYVFEYSSPNIAKPFHVGHLRSTIIGNVLAQLHQHLGYRVSKMNYLGDWGTQFGMLQVGVTMTGVTENQMRNAPIETLYGAYVAANTAAKTDPTIAERARKCFAEMETGSNAEMARQWMQYRRCTIAELERIYARLGVCFDVYDWESQYSQRQIGDVIAALAEKSLLHEEHDGRRVVLVEEAGGDGDRQRRVPIIKSDGSTLYLARDIAALVDRARRFNFARIFYIVDNAQTDHFNACFRTTAALCEDHLDLSQLKHVKFGRILGMSTRSGNAVFLRDVLDEARDIMLAKQLKSRTTKVALSSDDHAVDNKQVADVLGVSAVIINDLKQRRQRDYVFDWSKALQVNGDTGIKLQYTHCRLHNLLANVAGGDVEMTGIRPACEHLAEPEAQDLLYEIARFEQSLWQAKEQLEACILVNYLFGLCNATSRALKRLNVKNESCPRRKENRILLFSAAKSRLNQGMHILGLTPLEKM